MISAILFLIANYADYFYQADLFNWNNPLWKNGTRAKKWVWYLDWFPHDAWHVCQWLRNFTLILGSYFAPDLIWLFGAYVITRGIGFSLTYKLLN